MKKNYLLASIIAVVVLFASCSKDDSDSGLNQSTAKATVGGKSVSFTSCQFAKMSLLGYDILAVGGASSTGNQFSVSITQAGTITTNKVYTQASSTTTTGSSEVSYTVDNKEYVANDTIGTCSVKVTELSSSIAKVTFSGKLYFNKTTSIEVTNGEFYATVTKK
jgi:hypothetical protein